DGTLHSIQFIDRHGEKRYLKDGCIKGCFFPIGERNADGVLLIGSRLCFGEGLTTSWTGHAATRDTTIMTGDAGNIRHVALAFQEAFRKAPDLCNPRFTFLADNDLDTEAEGKGNPGVKAATGAARAVGGEFVIPPFGPNRPAGATDFNDLYLHHNKDLA